MRMDENARREYRTLLINSPQGQKFVGNSVTTAKYNFFTFLPVFLVAQFSSYSNIFFLIVSIVQQLPGVSAMGRLTTVVPLIVILVTTAIKELFEDVARHRDDRKINARLVDVWVDERQDWVGWPWKHVKVGQLIRVKNNAEFPADFVLVCSSEDASGIAYVETVNLDGESNLKIRRAPPTLNVTEDNLATAMRGAIVCDHPNEMIYSFSGMIVLRDEPKVSINEEQLLLRGAILRNTDWVIGVVVYTGKDTKIWRNSQEKPTKRSNSADMINWHMMVLFTAVFLLTACNSLLYIMWNYEMLNHLWYLPFGRTSGVSVYTFLTFVVGYSNMIPISMQIYLEIVRLFQAGYINADKGMYDEKTGTYAKAMTSNLNSDLGQVKYIFTDKTGTLTQNILELKRISVGGVVYEADAVGSVMAQARMENVCHHFFVAICVVPGVIPIYDKTEGKYTYYSSSTDQLALITAAKKYGYELKQRTYKRAVVSVRGETLNYEILGDIEFTSERRRTSVVVRTPDNKIILYVIGSDDTIFKRLARHSQHQAETSAHIIAFALAGLRTMCLAMAELTESHFRKWLRSFTKAKLSMTARQLQIARAAEKIEKNLTLLGAVASEDKLQDQVPETIFTLIAAGIKVWMLTGDKQETAVNIGYSTRLLGSDSTIYVLNSEQLKELQHTCVQISRQLSSIRKPALVVEGKSLAILLKSNYAEYFITLAMNCESVICCRMIPIQKAQVVNFVQNRTSRVTLAIGDGANDVAMIQTASVGVGISGVEGLQAVYAADYSIAVFKHLRRLLLVHGTWNYNRVCKIIFYICYKNLPIALILFYVSYASGWSGSSIFDDWAFTLYNVAFTDGATLAIGILEKDYPEEVLFNNPSIYRRNDWFNVGTFYVCLLNGTLHTVLILFFTVTICEKNTLWRDGYSDSYTIQGNMLYTNVLIIVILKCFLHLMNWTKFALCFALGTALLWFPVLFIYNFFWMRLPVNADMAGITSMLLSTPVFWLNLVFVPFVVLLIDVVIVVLYRTFWLRTNKINTSLGNV